MDEKVAIRIIGLEPESKVTVRASIDEEEMRFESFANYVANSDGLVDMTKRPSLNGTFTGKNRYVETCLMLSYLVCSGRNF